MTEMMKVYVMQQPQQLAFVDHPIPELEDGCVLLKSQRVSICSTDVGYYRGHLFPPQWPIIPGHEYVGEVVESKLSNNQVKVGDKVVYWGQTDFGGLAEYRVIRPLFPGTRLENPWFTERYFADDACAAAVVLDNDAPLEEASLIEPITSVLRSLLCNPPMPGDDVIVLGAGPCGLIALQLLKNWHGVHSVTVLDKNPYRLKVASNLGADYIYNVETEPTELERLIADSRSSYAQYVFDALPDITDSKNIPNTRTVAMKLLTPGGTYVVYGATEVEQHIDTWLILSKGLKLRATAFDVRHFPMWKTADILIAAKNIVSRQMISLAPIISNVAGFYSPDSVKIAFAEHAMNNRLKTMVSFDSSK
jgi:L-iditol 2-dehydrogenase/threonine 3-dehydrogenase